MSASMRSRVRTRRPPASDRAGLEKHEWLFVEVGRDDLAFLCQRMGGVGRQEQFFLRPAPTPGRRPHRKRDESEVAAAGSQHRDRRSAPPTVIFRSRLGCVRSISASRKGRHRDRPSPADQAHCSAQRLLGVADRETVSCTPGRPGGSLKKGFAGGGCGCACRCVEHGFAEFLLEQQDLTADRRLRHRQFSPAAVTDPVSAMARMISRRRSMRACYIARAWIQADA